jgi:arylsulfatase A-like enzyme
VWTAAGLIGCAAAGLIGCGETPVAHTNVLLIVLDDVGPEQLAAYGAVNPPATPALDRLAADGVVFRNVWSNPTCASARATLQTGRYGFRTGVRPVLTPERGEGLPAEEWTLPEALDRATAGSYAHAAIGKWHLGGPPDAGASAPNLAGYTHFSGTLGAAPLPSYTVWSHTTNGETRRTDRYTTTALVDESLAWIAAQDGPWFLHLAFHAAHAPWHVPPRRLQSNSTSASLPRAADGSFLGIGDRCPDTNPRPCYRAMIEAVSTEIGRLLDALPESVRARTTVLVVSDNGSPSEMAEDSQPAGVGLAERGIHVPLIASGAGVAARGPRDALVNTTDLFATVLELAAGPEASGALPADVALDARSLVPLLAGGTEPVREFAFSERFDPRRSTRNGSAIRGPRFKLVRWEGGAEELYDLAPDPDERNDLLRGSPDAETTGRLETLREQLDALLGSAIPAS